MSPAGPRRRLEWPRRRWGVVRLYPGGQSRTRLRHGGAAAPSPSLATPSRRFLGVLCAARPPSGASNLACVLVAQITGWLGTPPGRVARELPFAQRLRVSPKPSGSKYFPRHGSELSCSHMTRGFPQGQATQVFPSPGWLRAFFSPHGSGFPLCQLAQSFPFAGGSGVTPLAGWHQALPWPKASKLPIASGPGFPPRRVARSFLLAGGAGRLPARRPGFALCRVARGFPLTGGSGFPLRRLPSRW